MYICLCGYEPFFGVNEEQLIAANKKSAFEFHPVEWCGVSDSAKDLVSEKKCFVLRNQPKQSTIGMVV